MNYETVNQNPQRTFGMSELIGQLKKYLWLIALLVVGMGAAGYFVSSYLMTPKYESSIMMIVNTNGNSTDNITNDNITSAKNLVSTYAVIIKSNIVLDQVIENLNLNTEYEELAENVYVDAVDDTQVMRVAVRNEDKALSAEILNDIAALAPEIIVDSVEAGSCKVISHVITGDRPITPNIPKNVLLMSFLGLVLSVMIIITHAVFTVEKIVDDNDVQKYIGLPVLGVIPDVGRRE